MHSMTGFGQAVSETDICRAVLRIRCVNHRFLDIAVRMPEELRHQEPAMRELISERLHRGRIEVRLDVEDRREREVQVRINQRLVAALAQTVRELEEQGLKMESASLGDLVRIPDALRITSAMVDDAELAEQISTVLGRGLDEVEQMRSREGSRLAAAMTDRLEGLVNLVREIEAAQPNIQAELGRRLRDRMREIESGAHSIDEARMAQEIALLVERSDVKEELDRLLTHAAHFRQIMEQDGAVGKKLDFVAQEVLRELTTLASKCRHTDVMQKAIDAKLLCEQIREQVQNVE
jgi:uncharacterized protein (TIGR00255 family)